VLWRVLAYSLDLSHRIEFVSLTTRGGDKDQRIAMFEAAKLAQVYGKMTAR